MSETEPSLTETVFRAPDGEEYYAMALFFASHRWGDGPPPLDYSVQARRILHACVHNKAESKLTKEEIEEKLTTALNAKFKHPFKITYNWMDVIPPDENGKLRMIVCKVKQ